MVVAGQDVVTKSRRCPGRCVSSGRDSSSHRLLVHQLTGGRAPKVGLISGRVGSCSTNERAARVSSRRSYCSPSRLSRSSRETERSATHGAVRAAPWFLRHGG